MNDINLLGFSLFPGIHLTLFVQGMMISGEVLSYAGYKAAQPQISELREAILELSKDIFKDDFPPEETLDKSMKRGHIFLREVTIFQGNTTSTLPADVPLTLAVADVSGYIVGKMAITRSTG